MLSRRFPSRLEANYDDTYTNELIEFCIECALDNSITKFSTENPSVDAISLSILGKKLRNLNPNDYPTFEYTQLVESAGGLRSFLENNLETAFDNHVQAEVVCNPEIKGILREQLGLSGNNRMSQEWFLIVKLYEPSDNITDDDNLSTEMMDFYTSNRSSEHTVQLRRQLINDIQRALNSRFPGKRLKVEMFGSSATGLDTDTSDVDLCIVCPYEELYWDQDHLPEYYDMHQIARLLRSIGMVSVNAIASATVPIVKFKDPVSGFSCDINTNNILGIENSRMIKQYCLFDKRVAPLIFTIKHWAKNRNINNPASDRTPSTYTYVLMILFYLIAKCDPPVLPNLQDPEFCERAGKVMRMVPNRVKDKTLKWDATFCNNQDIVKNLNRETNLPYFAQQNDETLSELLTGFFYFYACFDYQRDVVSICDGQLGDRREPWMRHSFIVQDPFILDRNVAKICGPAQIRRMRNEFERAVRVLHKGGSFSTLCGK